MFARSAVMTLALSASVFAAAQPALAQQTLNVNLGYFTLRGEDARVDNDIINTERTFLAFDVADFDGPTVGAEWLVPLGEYIEAGAGASFSRRTVPSVYADLIDRDGSEIEQDLRLRLVPAAFTFRVLPTGQSSTVQPYFGAGLGVIGWRYSETGEFVDPSDRIFREQYSASGTATGPIVLGGLRVAGDSASAGFEVRYQSADAPLDSDFSTFTPDARIDLGGWTYQATVGYRFGR